MLGGRAGRQYVTRTHPDNRGVELGEVVGYERGELQVIVRAPLHVGDGVGFEPPDSGAPSATRGLSIDSVRTVDSGGGLTRQAIRTGERVPAGWRVVRNTDAQLVARARDSFSAVANGEGGGRVRLDVRLFGSAGAALKGVFRAAHHDVTVESDVALAPAESRALDDTVLREQLGRLGETGFVLGALDRAALPAGLFLPIRELNRLRQKATASLAERLEWDATAARNSRAEQIAAAIAALPRVEIADRAREFSLVASVYTMDAARDAAAAGATEIAFDPFLRHPAPPRARVRSLADELGASGVQLRLRTPTIVRPDDRRSLEPWLALGLPVLTGHAGLAGELAAAGRDVVADYAVNAFNAHTTAEFLRRGVRRVVASVELTANEIAQLASPWGGRGLDVVVYGRPEGMTIEHCVLSAAFDRVPTTCRDLCVQRHPDVTLTDPAGYSFPVATDSDCRNRLLHSRPIEASEFIPALWAAGIRGYHAIFNVPGDRVTELVRGLRAMLDALARNGRPEWEPVRALVGGEFTRGHFVRAV
jgi:putative protease